MQRILDFRALTGSLLLAWSTACAGRQGARAPFGTTPRGEAVSVYTLKNAHGMELRVLDYGGIILSLTVPDKSGRSADVVLGFDSLADYVRASPYFGAIIGRYGNRIAHARFTLDGRAYTLARNNGPNHLHGGVKGFDKVVWDVSPFKGRDSTGLTFHYTSPDGEEGYPGTLRATVTYTLTEANELVFDYQATTDRATPVNLTQHSYFNLSGDGPGKGDILGHIVTINADRFTPVDSTLIPSGELRSVQGTPFDFRTPTAIGARIAQDDEQLRRGGGYDHNFVLNSGGGDPVFAARVYEPTSGRVLEIYTTEPGMQFYSGNFLDGTLHGKHGVVYGHRAGFAMETQHFPDSPNHPLFPSTILLPGAEYRSRTVLRFSTR